MYVLSALIDRDKGSMDMLLSTLTNFFMFLTRSNVIIFTVTVDVYNYLPFLYSCVSFLGVIMLLIGTPLGFARLFTIVGDSVVKPTFMRNLDDEYFIAKFDEDCLKSKVERFHKSGENGYLIMSIWIYSPAFQ